MKRIVIIVMLLGLMSFPAFTQGQGILTINLPEGKCMINIDGKEYAPEGTIYSMQLSEGTHNIKVEQLDEQTFTDYENININSNENTLIVVPLKEKGVGMGFAFGTDFAKYSPSVPGDQSENSYALNAQYDVSWFYSRKIKKNIYFDMDICLFKSLAYIQDNYDKRSSLVIIPVRFGLKGKINRDLMIGTGINYSFWIFNEDNAESYKYPGGPGFQVYLEIIPISTEIGYMVKSLKRIYTDTAIDFNASGFYIKYKLYL